MSKAEMINVIKKLERINEYLEDRLEYFETENEHFGRRIFDYQQKEKERERGVLDVNLKYHWDE